MNERQMSGATARQTRRAKLASDWQEWKARVASETGVRKIAWLTSIVWVPILGLFVAALIKAVGWLLFRAVIALLTWLYHVIFG